MAGWAQASHHVRMTSVTAEQPGPAPAPAEPPAASRVGLGTRIARDTAYLLLSLPMGIVAFTLVVTGWSIALGSFITLIGIPGGLLTIGVTRGVAWIERRRAPLVVADPIRGVYRAPLPLHRADWRSARQIWDRIKQIVLDRQTWKDTGYELLLLPVGVIGFTVAVTTWSVTLALLSLPIWGWIPGVHFHLGFMTVHDVPTAAAGFLLGLASIPVTLALVRGTAAASGALASALLGPGRRQLEARVERLTKTRAGAVDAAAAELERIERDLHDGAQARLVAVALDLGLAEQRIAAGASPESAAELLREARVETQRALAELRDLARGIRPALLSERGLGPAVTSLAARVGGVPTSVTVDVGDRLPANIETAAYFVVAEALTNVAKHSGAGAAAVRLSRRGDILDVVIRDDGRGGADPEGGGLAGLRKRVEALDGTLTITSPAGGPTTLFAELPCGS